MLGYLDIRVDINNAHILDILYLWYFHMEYVWVLVFHIAKNMEYLAIRYSYIFSISMDLDEDDVAEGAAAAASSPAATPAPQGSIAAAMTPSSTITTATGSAAAATATPQSSTATEPPADLKDLEVWLKVKGKLKAPGKSSHWQRPILLFPVLREC